MKEIIYISGKHGFIGSGLNRLLKDKGYEVIQGEFDLKNIDKIDIYNPTIVIHCAAMVGSVVCDKYSNDACSSNIFGTWKIAKVANDLGAYFVYMSSNAIYKYEQDTLNVISETSEIKPSTWYGMTKFLGEEICNAIFGIDFLTLRLGFIYGDADKDKNSLIAALIRGNTVPLVGKFSKDYMHIDDCYEMITRLIEKRAMGIFNIGSGRSYDVSDIISFMSYKSFPFDNERDYFKSFIMDCSKANTVSGFIPQTSLWEKILLMKKEGGLE